MPKVHKGTYELIFSCTSGEISQGNDGAKRHMLMACWGKKRENTFWININSVRFISLPPIIEECIFWFIFICTSIFPKSIIYEFFLWTLCINIWLLLLHNIYNCIGLFWTQNRCDYLLNGSGGSMTCVKRMPSGLSKCG